jgi:hypothetical protein
MALFDPRVTKFPRDSYQTSHMISPPIPAFRAACPVINPFAVDTIEIPIPPTTCRMSVLPT